MGKNQHVVQECHQTNSLTSEKAHHWLQKLGEYSRGTVQFKWEVLKLHVCSAQTKQRYFLCSASIATESYVGLWRPSSCSSTEAPSLNCLKGRAPNYFLDYFLLAVERSCDSGPGRNCAPDWGCGFGC